MWFYDYTVLLQLRQQQGRTRREVCREEKLDVTQYTLHQWELGKIAPRADYLALLATVYGVKPQDFFKEK